MTLLLAGNAFLLYAQLKPFLSRHTVSCSTAGHYSAHVRQIRNVLAFRYQLAHNKILLHLEVVVPSINSIAFRMHAFKKRSEVDRAFTYYWDILIAVGGGVFPPMTFHDLFCPLVQYPPVS